MFEGGSESVGDYVQRVYGDFPAQGHVAGMAATVAEAFDKEKRMADMGICKPVAEQDPAKRLEAIVAMVGKSAFQPKDLARIQAIYEQLADS